MGVAKRKEIEAIYDLKETPENDAFVAYVQLSCAVDLIVLGQTYEYEKCRNHYLLIKTTSELVKEVTESVEEMTKKD